MDFGTAWSRRVDPVQLLRQGEAWVFSRAFVTRRLCARNMHIVSLWESNWLPKPSPFSVLLRKLALLRYNVHVYSVVVRFLHTRPLRSWYQGPYHAFGGFTLCDWRVTS